MRFGEITGQEEVKKGLLHSVRKGRIPHAQLLAGGEGSGALLLGIAYAQYLSCENPGEADSCGICASCRKYQKLVHPDLHFSFPFTASKDRPDVSSFMEDWRAALLEQPYLTLEKWMQRIGSENKQPNIPIAECHHIIKRLSLKPFESDYKVLIMWLPEFLRENSNSLLKIIEEPPHKTLFLLVTEQPERLLTTILSRTQLIRVPRLQDGDIAAYLVQHFEVEAEQAASMARLAEGNMAAAVRLAGAGTGDYEQQFKDWMRICYAGDLQKAAAWVEDASRWGRERQKNFIRYGIFIIRESLLVGEGLTSLSGYRESEQDFVERFSRFMHAGNAPEIIRELEKAVFHIERNANPRLLFLDVSLQLTKLLKTAMRAAT